MLEVSGLGAGYGRVQVLWDVDLEVGEDEIVALVGSNGAGKTTLRIAGRGYVLETRRVVSSGESKRLLDDPRVREAYLGVT